MIKFLPFHFLVLFCLAAFIKTNAQTKTIPYQVLPVASGGTVGSTIFFGASISSSTITITFVGPSDRYIALGFGSFMDPTDVFIYSCGKPGSIHTVGWNDYYNSSSNVTGVNNDATQNWTVASNNVASGQRTVVASRVLNTGDANDVVFNFAAPSLSVVWAKNATADYTIAYHGSNNRAFGIVLPWLSSPTASFTTSTTSICQGSSITYSNSSIGGQTTYTWSFQGGSPAASNTTNQVVTYSTPGTYSVGLIAANAIGTDTYNQISYITVNPTITPVLGLTASSSSVCAGSAISFTANTTNGGASPLYQWKVNGINVGTSSPNFSSTTLTNNAIVVCTMTSNAICPNPATVSSLPLTITVNSSAPASVSVSISSGSNPMCVGASVSFSATPGNGGNTPSYQWKVNNVNVGTNNPIFTTNSLVNSDVVTCVITSNAVCASSLTGTSSGITMTVSSVLVPSVIVTQNAGSNPACAGNLLSFSATPLNGGASPVFQWKLNGNLVGSNNSVYSSSSITNGAILTCSLMSSSQCASPTSANGNSITVVINPIPPTPVITPSGSILLCTGKSLVLSSSAATGNQWSNGATTQSVSISTAGVYHVLVSINSCSSTTSSLATVSLLPLPAVTMQSVGSLCKDDGMIVLQGNPSNGGFSGTGVTGTFFNPQSSGSGTIPVVYTYTDANTCSNTASISILVNECVGIQKQQPANIFRVFPNPGNGVYSLETGTLKVKYLVVHDLLGKLVFSCDVAIGHQFEIDIHEQMNAVYVLEIFTDKEVLRSKLLKQE